MSTRHMERKVWGSSLKSVLEPLGTSGYLEETKAAPEGPRPGAASLWGSSVPPKGPGLIFSEAPSMVTLPCRNIN